MSTLQTLSFVSHLECSSCGAWHDAFLLQSFSACCNKPLLVRYNSGTAFSRQILKNRRADMWRYKEMLPVLEEKNIVSLGEGMTPLIELKNLNRKFGCFQLLLKDEGKNPTGSFKARGMSVAVSKAKEAGIKGCIIPTAGNAGVALSAYCAAADMHAVVVMPKHTPKIFMDECELYGADLILVDGLISDCARTIVGIKKELDLFDISTLKEPYRLEGKKTMGYEIAEQLNWELPHVILYPTGGGTGLIGMWKAFHEMIELGWIKNKLPKMIAVQAENCQPIVQTWNGNQKNSKNYSGNASIANGLAVPNPFGEELILKVLRESHGTALAISDQDMIAALREIATEEGLIISPEGAALLKATSILLKSGFIKREEKILLLNTGSGYKYMENIILKD